VAWRRHEEAPQISVYGASSCLRHATGKPNLDCLLSRDGWLRHGYNNPQWLDEYAAGYHIVLDSGPVVTVRWDQVAL